jgi:acyl-CoA synthetase (AMP-forming)/AMP-acid ligase II
MTGRDYDWFVRRGIVTNECLGYFLETSAGYWPDREMVSFGDARYTYRDMHRWSLAAARMLVEKGVRPGDRVLIQAVNSAEILVIQFAVWRIGGVTIPVVPMYRRHELKSIVADVTPRIVVSSGKVGSRCYCSEIDEVLAEFGHAPLLRIVLDAAPYRPGWTTLPPRPSQDISDDGLPEPAAASECAVILYTSGSTAAPKGAKLRSGAIVNNGRAMQKIHGISAEDVALCATPLGHTGALINALIVPMTAGGRAVVMPAWSPDDAVAVIEREKVTFMGSPPLILQDIVDRYEASNTRGHRIGRFYCGGGTMPPSLIMRADAVGIIASRNYGMTETTGTVAACDRWQPIERRAHYDGLTFYSSEIEIVDGDRRPLPTGEIGEIRIRCPLLMMEYTDPAATAAQMDAEGWFYTGDLGRLDADKWLTFEGRLKDIINRGGEKFSCQDIETAIASYPDVVDVAVVGAPHPRFGEVVAAFLRLKPDAVWNGPDAILAHLEEAKLAKAKRPVQWHVLKEFPRTPSGKVQKQGLREMLRNG